MKTPYLSIIVISAIFLIFVQMRDSFAELENPLAGSSFNQECADKVTSQERAQDTPIDKNRALSLAANYPEYQIQTAGHNYTLNDIYHEFNIDSSACTAQVRDVVVEFIEKTPNGDSLMTVIEDLGLHKVITLETAKINNDYTSTGNGHYMTSIEPPNYEALIIGIVVTGGVTAGVLFFIFRIRRRK